MVVAMATQKWAQEEFGTCVLGDKRRTRRIVKLAAQVANNPSASIPALSESWSDCKAAYDLFDEEDVTFEAILEPHWQRTQARPAGRYLVLGDTTEVDFGYRRKIADTGPTGNGGGNGFLMHSALVTSAEGDEVIGLAGGIIHVRQAAPQGENTTQRLQRDRESQIWGQVIDQVGPPPAGVQWVHVLDRGGDNFEVYCHLLEQRADWVVRVTQTSRNIFTPQGERLPLKEYLQRLPRAGQYTLKLRARPQQSARTANLEVCYGSLKVPVPAQHSPYVKQLNPQPISMWVVHVREVDAPPGVKPLQWILLTSLPVETFGDACQIISYYEKRWMIEEWHKALKSGCQLEERQLKTLDRLKAIAALLSIVAVRLLQLRSMARTHPDDPAVNMVPLLWITMLLRVLRRTEANEMTVRQFYRGLAQLGGFLARKSDGEPGWITIWRGWDKLHLMIRGARLARQPLAEGEK